MRVGVVDGALTRDLRRRVLRPALGPDDPLPGDERSDVVHLAALDDAGRVGCTCFVHPDPCAWRPGRPAWHLRQMATEPDRRGAGLGAAVVDAAIELAAAEGAEVLWCDARETAIGFYARLGFVRHGEVFVNDRGIRHVAMWRELRRGPVSSPAEGTDHGRASA